MNWFSPTLGLLAGIVSAGAFIPYIYSILNGKTKPSIATWSVWTVVGGMTLVSYILAGGWTTTVWGAIVYVLGPGIILILAFKYRKKGESSYKVVETICMAGAGVGVLVWFVTKSAVLALAIFLLIDFLGALPTMVKSYRYPFGVTTPYSFWQNKI